MLQTVIDLMFFKERNIKILIDFIQKTPKCVCRSFFIGWTNGSRLIQRIYVICLFIRNLLIPNAFDYIYFYIQNLHVIQQEITRRVIPITPQFPDENRNDKLFLTLLQTKINFIVLILKYVSIFLITQFFLNDWNISFMIYIHIGNGEGRELIL